jgi:hypothetical protein
MGEGTAIIVAHGVGDPPRGETGRSIATLLERADRRLGSFGRDDFSVHVEGPSGEDGGHHEVPSFTNADGLRVAEIYWGDLSTPRRGGFGALLDLLEIAVFLPDLGTRALDAVNRRIRSPSRAAAAALMLHRMAAWLVAPVAPLVVLVVVAVSAQFLLVGWAVEHPQALKWSLDVVLGCLVLVAARGLSVLFVPKIEDAGWRHLFTMLAPVLALVSACAVVAGVHLGTGRDARMHIAVLLAYAAAIALGLVLVVRRGFQPRARSSTKVYLAAAAVPPIATAVMLLTPGAWWTYLGPGEVLSPAEMLTSAMLGALMLLTSLATFAWGIKVLLQTASLSCLPLVSLAARRDGGKAAEMHVTRIVMIANLTLAVSSWVFLSFALGALWAMLLALRPQLDGIVARAPLLYGITDDELRWTGLGEHLEQLLRIAGTPLATWGSAFAALGAGLAMIALAPVALGEVPWVAQRLGRERQRATVDGAFRGLLFPAAIVLLATTVVNAVGIGWVAGHTLEAAVDPTIAPLSESDVWGGPALYRVMRGAIALVIGAGGGLLALRETVATRLPQLAPVIDVLYDVERYVRPTNRWVPSRRSELRERVSARVGAVVAALRAQGVQRFVFVAHSQGTVIFADYLLSTAADRGEDGAARTSLLTFGSPLLALYAWAFPADYHWVGSDQHRPGDAASLGVARWINCWTDGDYVGRWIVSADGDGPDRSIGPGAHVGYWRHEQIGAVLLALCAGRPPPAGQPAAT